METKWQDSKGDAEPLIQGAYEPVSKRPQMRYRVADRRARRFSGTSVNEGR